MIILGIILLLLGFILSIVIILKDQVDKLDLIGVYSSVAIMVGGTMMICENNCPQAIDVYRGKTTLQITYKGNTPIDTTVVYK
jgi:hypothetical protein